MFATATLAPSFLGTRVLVTGAGSGIGFTIASEFANAGAEVFICDVDAGVLDKALSQYQKGAREGEDQRTLFAGGVVCDVSKEVDVMNMFAQVRRNERMDRSLHVLVSNAGSGGPTSGIADIKYEDWAACVGVNLHGAFLVSREGVKLMRDTKVREAGRREAGGGSTHMSACDENSSKRARTMGKFSSNFSFIAISSTAGILGYPNRTPYASAKWGLIGLVKSLALELGPENIRCNAICPGAINNARMDGIIEKEAKIKGVSEEAVRANYCKQNALQTFIDMEDIARQAMLLASEWGHRTTGQIIAVDGMCESLR